jgi:regulator of replication initiation timing/predicted RNA-binding Zn-ribbon protein involved in translation (DUF1610 family)
MSSTESEEVVTQPAPDSVVAVSDRDIVFNCPHCEGELVVDRDGAGMTFNCPHCGGRIAVPFFRGAGAGDSVAGSSPGASESAVSSSSSMGLPGAARLSGKQLPTRTVDFTTMSKDEIEKRVDELKLHLKEHQSQTTEMRGHLNRAVIEMNRLQLKLQKLRERGTSIEQELAAAKAFLEKPAGSDSTPATPATPAKADEGKAAGAAS